MKPKILLDTTFAVHLGRETNENFNVIFEDIIGFINVEIYCSITGDLILRSTFEDSTPLKVVIDKVTEDLKSKLEK